MTDNPDEVSCCGYGRKGLKRTPNSLGQRAEEEIQALPKSLAEGPMWEEGRLGLEIYHLRTSEAPLPIFETWHSQPSHASARKQAMS